MPVSRISPNEARVILQECALQPVSLLGAEMEGAVFALDTGRVAKVWFERTVDEVSRLRGFYDAVAKGGQLRVAQIDEVRTAQGHVVSVEHLVAGSPLGGRAGTRPPPSQHVAARLGDALAALAATPDHPALTSLPMLPGEPIVEEATSFTQMLCALVPRRVAPVASALDDTLRGGLDRVLNRTLDDLTALPPRSAGLVHGDLVPDNVLVDGTNRPGVIDFGFLTTYGDPDFDVAITPAIYDMYSPAARSTTDQLTAALTARFATRQATVRTYRSAYALITAGAYGTGPEDGHFAWCASMLQAQH